MNTVEMERSLTKVTVKVKLDIQSFWNFFNLYENFKKAVRSYLFTFATFALKEKKNTDLDFSMLWAGELAQGVKCYLMTGVQPMGPTWWKERTDSCRLPAPPTPKHACHVTFESLQHTTNE